MRLICSLLFLSVSSLIFGQQHVFLDGQFDYGYLFRQMDQKGEVLKGNSVGSEINLRFSGSYRVFNRLQISGGVGLNRQSIQLKDKNFETRNEGFEVPIRIKSNYLNYFVSLKYSHRLHSGLYAYTQVGYEINKIGADQLTKTDSYIVGFEDLTISTNYIEENTAITPEIGIESFLRNGGMIGLGLKYTAMSSPMMRADYMVTKGQDLVAEDGMKLSGANIALTFRYSLLLWHKVKKEKPIREVKDPVEIIPIVDSVKTVEVKHGEANDRDYQITNKVRVQNPTVRIEVWDHQMEDGDIISLILNDRWIIQNYELVKKKRVFYVELQEGRNNFILYAHNLGKYAPNTASVSVVDGDETHTIILESDLKESGALEIKYVPKK